MMCRGSNSEEAFADLGEAALFVEADRAVVLAIDAKHKALFAEFACVIDRCIHERFAYAEALEAMEQVDATEFIVFAGDIDREVRFAADDVADRSVAGRGFRDGDTAGGQGHVLGVGFNGVVLVKVRKDVVAVKNVSERLEKAGPAYQ